MSNFNFLGSFLGATNKTSKDGHDLSNQEVLSVPFAVNVPLKSYSFVPNEHYKVRVGGAVQTSPMREDNFAQLYSNLKAVAVPLSSVMRNYMQLLPDASRETRTDPLFPEPAQLLFNMQDVIAIAFTSYLYSKLTESFVQSIDIADLTFETFGTNPIRIKWHYKGDTYEGSQLNEVIPETDKAARAFVRMMDNSSYLEIPQERPFVDFLSSFAELSSRSGSPIYMDILRLLDNLGYGNYYPILDILFQGWLNSVFGEYVDRVNFSVRLRDNHVRVDFRIVSTQISNYYRYFNKFSKNVDLMPILCYQYYVYSCEKTNYRNPSVTLVTADWILSEFDHGTAPIHDSFEIVDNRSTIRLIPITSTPNTFVDYFTNYRDRLDADYTLIQSPELSMFYDYFFQLSNPLLSADVYTSSQLSVVSGSIPTVSSSELTSNLVKAYAETSALYSIRQSLLRGGVTRRGQMEALFGTKGSDNTFEPVTILDASRSQVDINGLMNMAETDAAPLGQRGARGDGRFGLEFTYDSKDYGYIFIVNYFTSSMFYENFMLKREYGLSHDSWWMPQFNHLGLEPIRNNQLSFMRESVDTLWDGSLDSQDFFAWSSGTVGFTARNFELKQEVNKVHGLFTNFGFASYNGVTDISERYLPGDFVQGNAAFGGYIPTLIDPQVHLYEHESDLYFKPDMVNNLFTNMVSGALFGDYSADHFKLAFNFSVHKVSPMPKLGLFKLDI